MYENGRYGKLAPSLSLSLSLSEDRFQRLYLPKFLQLSTDFFIFCRIFHCYVVYPCLLLAFDVLSKLIALLLLLHYYLTHIVRTLNCV